MTVDAGRLAVEGGVPAVAAGMHRSWPVITDEDCVEALGVLRSGASDYSGPLGKYVRGLEEAWASYCGTPGCVAVGTGTDALWACLIAVGVRPGDEVIVPALSFTATADAAILAGATVVWCDIDPRTYNLDPRLLEGLISARTRAIVVVHAHGLMADMDAVWEVAARHGLMVVEDAAQAAGATYKGRRAGSVGSAAAFSLNVYKVVQGGDGGVVTATDGDVLHAARLFAQFGEERRPLGPEERRSYWARWFGINSRVHPVAAAIATSGLRRAPLYLERGQANGLLLSEGLAGFPGLEAPYVPEECTSTFCYYRLRFDPRTFGWEGEPREFRDRMLWVLAAEGVPVGTWQEYPLPALPKYRREECVPWTPGAQDGPLKPWDPSAWPEASRLLEESIIVGAMPYPLQVQEPGVMARYLHAFEKVHDRKEVVLTADYKPRRLVPAIPAGDL